MELTKIRNLSDEELKHQEKTSSEQLFRIRFQVSLGQNDGVKKLRQLRKEIAQIKTVARERELGIQSETGEEKQAGHLAKTEVAATKAAKAREAAPAAEAKAEKAEAAAPAVKATTAKAKKAAPAAKAKTGKTKKAASKGDSAAKKKTGKAKGASK
ncbi:MAG: 50S ribosomal protein L29 [Terracidiphilus sp.]|jgi:large subunit ribosomal protein L29